MEDEEPLALPIDSREPLGDAAFSITARIALQLGRESISNSIVAIIELVKNAYDADAENVWIRFHNLDVKNSNSQEQSAGLDGTARVKHALVPEIIIEYDGNGMTRTQMENSWLVIGVDTKLTVNRSKGKNRVLTGEKGLGRLGLDRLCKQTKVQTFTSGGIQGLEIEIDWTKYEGTNAKLESITHNVFRIPKKVMNADSGEYETIAKGTRLTLIGLKDAWSRDDLERLRTELALLVSPFAGLNDFSIHLFTDKVLTPDGRIASENLLQAAEWKVVSTLERDGDGEYVFNFDMTSPLREAKYHNSPTLWTKLFPERHGRDPECGSVRCELYYIPREAVPEKSLRRAQILRFMDNNQGIRIYRDNFRVMPYGQPSGEGDWLGLGLRRTREPTPASGALGRWKLGYNQVVGAVFIKRETNSALLDQTNREGIVEGEPYYDLRRFVLKSVELLELNHQRFVHAQGPKPKPTDNQEIVRAREEAEETSKASREVIERMRDVVQTTAQLLNDPTTNADASSHASEKVGELFEIVEALNKTVTEQQGKQEQLMQAYGRLDEERQEEFQRQKDTLGNLASLGILATTFGHETEGSSNVMVANSNALKKQIENIPWLPFEQQQAIQENVDSIVHGAKRISTFAVFTLRNVARDKRFRTKMFLDKVVRRVFSSFRQSLEEERQIKVEFDFPEPDQIPPITAFNIDWESIIVNFITNAVWSLENTPAEKRKIRVRLLVEEDTLTLAFADSGCGIAEGTEDSIFEPTFSTKRNRKGDLFGTGMGLAIVQGFVQSYEGTIRVESPCEIGGAQFIIEIPLRVSEQEVGQNG